MHTKNFTDNAIEIPERVKLLHSRSIRRNCQKLLAQARLCSGILREFKEGPSRRRAGSLVFQSV
jgi:hypothetical protein